MQDKIKFYVADNEDLPAEKAGTLYMLLLEYNKSYWYDNHNREWLRSLFTPKDIMSDDEFTSVESFDNGYVTINDAINYYNLRVGPILEDLEM